jgi:hypothetical protein
MIDSIKVMARSLAALLLPKDDLAPSKGKLTSMGRDT